MTKVFFEIVFEKQKASGRKVGFGISRIFDDQDSDNTERENNHILYFKDGSTYTFSKCKSYLGKPVEDCSKVGCLIDFQQGELAFSINGYRQQTALT
mmetsp:Transcript_9698/g.14768  ORF Transcript_9698/g.14768 Transcript_9698/m.14768 type:complete len:97 (+) Transcript_9698:179-469(+)